MILTKFTILWGQDNVHGMVFHRVNMRDFTRGVFRDRMRRRNGRVYHEPVADFLHWRQHHLDQGRICNGTRVEERCQTLSGNFISVRAREIGKYSRL